MLTPIQEPKFKSWLRGGITVTSTTAIAAACLTMLLPFATQSRADERDKKTIVTFNSPVEIPGRVLPAGPYVFKLLNPTANILTVQIFNQDETKLITTVLAVPDERIKSTGKPVITFRERPANSPEAVRAWFYPGEHAGYEFAYPEARASQLAKSQGEHVPSTPDGSDNKGPVKAVQPSGQVVDLNQVHKH
jgi:hypothetical protein